jgi:hypothetical protein
MEAASIFLKSEDHLKKIIQPKTIEIKTMVVAPLRVTYLLLKSTIFGM